MLNTLKNLGRAVIPKRLFRAAQPHWHGMLARLGHWWFGRPSEHLIVVGVTGTAGKSTTVNILAQILNNSGHKTGYTTTTNYSDGEMSHLNEHGMTMPGGWLLQKQLSAMVRNGCTHAVLEVSSEGLAQNRHLGVNFDMSLLTNLSPAHLDNHGGFENYRTAKAQLFQALQQEQKPTAHPKMIGVNLDSEHAEYFLDFPADKKFGITLQRDKQSPDVAAIYKAEEVRTEPRLSFRVNNINFDLDLIGEFNAYNALMAIAAANMLGVALDQCRAALAALAPVPGRIESIPNRLGIQIFVDYAPEPAGMQSALQAMNGLPHNRIIHVFGATGGFRDLQKRFDFGSISGKLADIIIITNDDVYDSDPALIARNIGEGIAGVAAPERKAAEVLTILDRRAAINRALKLAASKDIVIITGKGSEQFLVLPGNQRVPWDERNVVREELQKL